MEACGDMNAPSSRFHMYYLCAIYLLVLAKIFESVGSIEECTMGPRQGECTLVFSSEAEMEKAITLNEKLVLGKPITVVKRAVCRTKAIPVISMSVCPSG